MPNMYSDSDDISYTPSTEPEDERMETLVFPLNVHESIKASGGLKKSEKTGIIISFWIFGCAILAYFMISWLRPVVPGHYILITVVVEILLQLTVGMYLLRFLLDEKSMMNEVGNKETSFAEFFRIYKERLAAEGTYPFDLLEMNDGSYAVFIECRLGHNTNTRSENTYHANRQVTEILNKSGIARKVFYHNEQFKNSQAAEDLLNIVKGIDDPVLFASYREIVQNYLNIAQDSSNVISCTYVLFFQTTIQKDEMEMTINSIMRALTEHENCYREVEILPYEEIVEFLRGVYQLEVLDMGLARVETAAKKESIGSAVRVLKIYGKSGKIYTNAEFSNLRSELLKESGIQN